MELQFAVGRREVGLDVGGGDGRQRRGRPFGIAVLVDDLGADALHEIVRAQRTRRRPILLAQHVFQRVEFGGPADGLQRDGQRDGGAAGDQVGGVVGRTRVVAAQCRDDVRDGLAGVAVVDPIPLGQ